VVKMVAGKYLFFMIIYTSCLIICESLKEIRPIVNEELMPQDLGDVRTDKHGQAQLYMPPSLWGHNNAVITLICIPYFNTRQTPRNIDSILNQHTFQMK
jgi:hypothetical protein